MAEETVTQKKTEKTVETKVDMSKFKGLTQEYISATSKEERSRIIAENPILSRVGILTTRAMEREVLPFPAALDHKLSENSLYAWAKAGVFVSAAATAGVQVWRGAKWVWDYFRPV